MGIANNEKLLITSAGGGKVGGPLMKSVFKTFSDMSPRNSKLLMLTGPFFDQDEFDKISTASKQFSNITVKKFAADFIDLLTAADAMISMAGYNTCMDILTSGIPAAVLPFAQNHEQRSRAEKISKYIPLQIINENDLVTSKMEDVINTLLNRNRTSQDHGIDLDGAKESAKTIRKAGKR